MANFCHDGFLSQRIPVITSSCYDKFLFLRIPDTADNDEDRDDVPDTLRALFEEIGRTYAPFMIANDAALKSGAHEMEFQLDGVRYWQRPFPYQKKCLAWLRDEYARLSPGDRAAVDQVLADTGCEVLLR